MDKLGFTAFVALDACEELIASTLRRAFAYIAPSSSLIISSSVAGDAEQAFRMSVDGHEFGIALFDGKLPEPEAAFAQKKSVFWADAANEMAEHRAFLAIGAGEHQERHGLARAQSVALTRLIAAIVEVAPALGVYWRGAEVCAPPQRVARAPGLITQGKWPVDMWIGYQLFGQNDPESPMIGLQTRGAAAYLGFELEIPPFEVEDLKEPLRILYNAAGYLMNYGDVIRNGQLVEVVGERRTTYQLHLGADGEPGLARLTVVDRDHRKMN
jgi:hypothetical protein